MAADGGGSTGAPPTAQACSSHSRKAVSAGGRGARPQAREPVGPERDLVAERPHQPALAQFALEQARGKQGRARALRRRFGQGQGRVEHRTPNHGAGHARGTEPGGPFIGAVRAQQRLPRQVGRRAQPGGERGRAHGRQGRFQQAVRFRAVPGAVAETDRAVQPFARKVHPVVVGEQAQIDERTLLLECLQPRQQPSHGEGAHGAHGEHFARACVAALRQRALDAAERVRQRRQQRQTFIGERQPARQPAEQRLAQALLEVADVLAHRGLRHVQLFRRAGEIQVPRRDFERPQGIERQVHGCEGEVFPGEDANYCRWSPAVRTDIVAAIVQQRSDEMAVPRRTWMVAAVCGAAAPWIPDAWAGGKKSMGSGAGAFARAVQEVEASVGGRLGVALLDMATGRQDAHRGDERFPPVQHLQTAARGARAAARGPGA